MGIGNPGASTEVSFRPLLPHTNILPWLKRSVCALYLNRLEAILGMVVKEVNTLCSKYFIEPFKILFCCLFKNKEPKIPCLSDVCSNFPDETLIRHWLAINYPLSFLFIYLFIYLIVVLCYLEEVEDHYRFDKCLFKTTWRIWALLRLTFLTSFLLFFSF